MLDKAFYYPGIDKIDLHCGLPDWMAILAPLGALPTLATA
jgi:hypothetical protein